jgi:hypothetical protein
MIHSCCSMSHTQKGDVSPLGERAAGIAFFFTWNPLHPSVVLNKLVDFFLGLGDVNYFSSKVTSQRGQHMNVSFLSICCILNRTD